MSYRKLKADYLFDGFKIRTGDWVLICGEDGQVVDLVEESQAGGGLETFSGLITPGFINAHCHLELSHLKGLIPEKQGLVNFVLSVVSQRNQPEHVRQEAIISAESEMLDNGIVAVGDICNGADTLMAKSARRMDYYNFIELLGWKPEQASSRFETAQQLAGLFKEQGLNENHLSFSPHAPYSVSDELWRLISAGFRNKTITIHHQESRAENEFFQQGSGDLLDMYQRMKIDSAFFKTPGMTSLSYVLPKLKEASRVLLVHNTYTEEADVKRSKDYKGQLFFCFCPNANQYIEDRLPDIPMFIENNAQMVLGTDSLASNHQLSILEEMKTIRRYYPDIPTGEMLVWATSNGARALAFEEKLGDFTPGKKPGVVLIENIRRGEITEESNSRRIV